MFLERLSGTLVSVPEIVTDPKYDGEHVAVHGLLYAGRHSQGQFLCLPKEGPFNGIFEGSGPFLIARVFLSLEIQI
jgi:hypothetical protein